VKRQNRKVLVNGKPQIWTGVNFWSRTGGPLMSRNYDPGVVREELDALCSHGGEPRVRGGTLRQLDGQRDQIGPHPGSQWLELGPFAVQVLEREEGAHAARPGP